MVRNMTACHAGPNDQLASVRAGIRAVLAALPVPIMQPVSVDGKTPGQVFAQISSQVPLSLPLEKAREIIATNLLRAFGQPRQTTQDAADALRRVRDRIDYGPTENWRGDMRRIIDDELAKLSAKPPSDPATPKLFVAENELRGSYFCTAITLRPWLHVGHDIEFDDIPRILKLGRNDVVEVRVVERAKQ